MFSVTRYLQHEKYRVNLIQTNDIGDFEIVASLSVTQE